jgi:chromodomain-helicase-DNA-binding protein 1
MGDSAAERDKDPDAMVWYLLKPVHKNFERILSTTKATVKSSKERAGIFGRELVIIGDFLGEMSRERRVNEGLVDRFW